MENENWFIIEDIKPASRFHCLVIPKSHIGPVSALGPQNRGLIKEMVDAGNEMLESKGYSVKQRRLGFHRPPFNSVTHLHLHCIGLPITNVLMRTLFPSFNCRWFYHADRLLNKLN
ncbi:hypothetical protein H4R33_006906 [Dimargaris cristalligena]|nr:hypothetical protein H4R33_006906 [Dimargaris cristalligena]